MSHRIVLAALLASAPACAHGASDAVTLDEQTDLCGALLTTCAACHSRLAPANER